MKEIIEKGVDKVPDYESFAKSPNKAALYVVLLLALFYFIYNEFYREDDCSVVIAASKQIQDWQAEYTIKLESKIETYEHALQIERGINKRIVEKTDSILINEGN